MSGQMDSSGRAQDATESKPSPTGRALESVGSRQSPGENVSAAYLVAARESLRSLFFSENGFSCAQVILDVLQETGGTSAGSSTVQAYALGGGIGHTGEGWCGALVGGAMAIGEFCAGHMEDPLAVAPATWQYVQDLHEDFVNEFGCATCQELLGFSIQGEEGLAHYEQTNCKEDICFRNLVFVLERLLPIVQNQSPPF